MRLGSTPALFPKINATEGIFIMIFGMDTFTFVHVLLSLIGIASGFVMLYGLLTAQRMGGWTTIFLATTLATTLTGFFFPFHGFTPAIGVGIVSTIVLIVTIAARYVFRLNGSWRWIYAGGAVLAFYLNFFVLVAQSFQKIPALNAYAPTGSEPPFAITQGIVLLAFVVAGALSLRTFRPAAAA
jgi:hypothetical protein